LKKLRILVLTVLMISYVNVHAAGVKVGSDSCQAGDTNKKVAVELVGSDLANYTGIEFTLSVEGSAYANIEFSYNASMSFKLNGNVYSITSNSGLQAGNIGNVIYSTTSNLNSNFTVVPKNVTLIKNDGSKTNGTSEGGTITFIPKKSNDATLTSLSVDKGVLSPAFSPTILNYNLKIDSTIDSITINADTAAGATKTGTGLQRINDSVKAFNIVVTAEDGQTTNTYTINLLRGDENSDVMPLLKSLKINTLGCKLSPKFDSKKTKYTVKVDEDVDELDFDYETVDPTSIVKIKGNKNFGKGKNKVKIIVSNSDETKSTTYNIIVNKQFKKVVKVKKQEKKSHKKIFIIIGIILLLLLIIFIVLLKKGKLPFGKKNKNKNKNKKNKKDKKKKSKKEKPNKKDIEEDELDFEEEEETTSYNSEDFIDKYEEELEKTKEFNFKDFK